MNFFFFFEIFFFFSLCGVLLLQLRKKKKKNFEKKKKKKRRTTINMSVFNHFSPSFLSKVSKMSIKRNILCKSPTSGLTKISKK